jgi:serine protease Do
LFESHEAAVFQIRVIDTAANNKSSTGTGFLVSNSGILATNYHVIASAIDAPAKYRIEMLMKDQSVRAATVLNVDIVNDLALLQVAPLAVPPLQLATLESAKGETVYSIGFPYDLGITVIDGTYNGLAPHSVTQRVHFAGSLNPGMSGGPAFNRKGEVIGVNVSTAGNQMSFLVPVSKLAQLLQAPPVEVQTDMPAILGAQLTANSNRVITELLAGDWSTQPLGGAQALGELTGFLRCWGNSKDMRDKTDKQPFFASRACQTDHNIYLSQHLTTGTIELQFYWIETDELNPLQFYDYYQRVFSAYRPGNFGTSQELGNWACDENFVLAGAVDSERTKTVFCLRAYKKFSGLYDVLFLQGSVDRTHQAFMTHFTIAGTTREMALAFTQKFMDSGVW